MSQLKIGINGLGRIGRLLFRYGFDDIDIVAVNARKSSKMMAHLLQYDSVHGVWDKKVDADSKNILVGDKKIAFLQKDHPAQIPWDEYGVDVVIECTGAFKKQEDLKGHLSSQVKHVLVSTPLDQPDLTLVYGVNQDIFQKDKHKIISNASCTTNCLAPLIKVLQEQVGIDQAFMTTIHSYTNDQKILDSSHKKDFRRARTAALNMIPTSTGAAKAIESIFPKLKGRIKGMAVRVPVANVSLVDLVVQIKKETTAEEINSHFKQYSQQNLKNILGYEENPLVSSDFIGRTESSVVDALSTEVLDKKLVKILAWYDNEAGFSQRLLDFIHYIESKK